jgi:hypothetical protein
MDFSYDIFGQPEIPSIILTNPSGEELYSLGLCYETDMKWRFNDVSEFSFLYPQSIDGGKTLLESYEEIKTKRLVLIDGFGYFQITSVSEDLSGYVPVKKVVSSSIAVELIRKRLVAYGGTKPLWNPIPQDNSQKSILEDMISLAPNWSVGHIDGELLTLYRTFNVSDTNIYAFLINDVSKAFDCVFVFDNELRTISAYAGTNVVTPTDIFLSFENVISSAELSENSDEITTCLSVHGGGGLNIRVVNPLGNDKIYDFSYYKNTSWMNQSLIDKIDFWENLILSNQTTYSENLALLSEYNSDLLSLNNQLSELRTARSALVEVQKARIQQSLPYNDIRTQLAQNSLNITQKQNQIASKNSQIDDVILVLKDINDSVNMKTVFTPEEFAVLDNFIFENTYMNNNIIQTDSMTYPEIQEQAMSLYNQAKSVLTKVSQPRYEFSLSAVNYPFLKEFGVFSNQTVLACSVVAEIKPDVLVTTVLLEVAFSFDDPEHFDLTFANRLRLDDEGFVYTDLVGQLVKTSSSVTFDSVKWANWETDYKNKVSKFITSSLNASLNNLVSNSNQEIVIDQNGLRGRQLEGSDYGGKQVWLVNNMLAFSDDGFNTAKLALGEIPLSGGGTAYGLVGDIIVGRILAGNTLTITNSSNNFILNETGATLNNARFNIQTTNTRVIIDPTASNVFRIQKNEGGTFNNKFWVDNVGNVNFSGNLTGATGTFSGTLSASVGNIGTLVIDSSGLKTPDGNNYLRGNGELKWGGLTITGSTASFSGDIFANKIVGAINWSQIVNAPLPPEKINSGTGYSANGFTSGTMSGNRIFGGTAQIDGVTSVSGTLFVNGNLQAYNNVTFFGSAVLIGSGTNLYAGSLGNLGRTIGYAVQTPYGTRYLYFTKGILTSYT